jgi:hypothetical protein
MTPASILRSLVLLAGLAAGFLSPATHAADYCVENAQQLAHAIVASADAGGEATVRLVEGTLVLPAGINHSMQHLRRIRIEGGWLPGCVARAGAMARTVLSGDGSARFELRVCGELSIDRVDFSDFVAVGAAVTLAGETFACEGARTLQLAHARITGNSGSRGLQMHALRAATLANVLVAGNAATHSALHLQADGADADLAHVTVAGNSGPGLSIAGTAGHVRVWNSVSGGNGGTDLVLDEASATPRLLNVVAGSLAGATDPQSIGVVIADPLLTPAYVPAAGSPAINAGSGAAFGSGHARDLAGAPRWRGSRPDLGAFESVVEDELEFIVSQGEDGGAGSLRQAIVDANASGQPALIRFALPGGCGPHTITLQSELPEVNGTLRIDGTTQPGASASVGEAFDGAVCIRIAPAIMVGGRLPWGLRATSGRLAVRGLSFTGFAAAVQFDGGADHVVAGSRFEGSGVPMQGGNMIGVHAGAGAQRVRIGGASAAERNLLSDNELVGVLSEGTQSMVSIANNLIGTGADGLTALPNDFGIAALGSGQRIVDNLISANRDTGIVLSGAGQHQVHGNRIGVDVGGSMLGNGGAGVHVYSSGNLIGAAGRSNLIAHNGGAGVWIDLGDHNRADGNRVFGNDRSNAGWLPIDLAAPGLDANDDGDADTGPNGMVNHPLITSAAPTALARYQIGYALATIPNTSVVLSVYGHSACTSGGIGELGEPLMTRGTATDASGLASGELLLPQAVPSMHRFSVVATIDGRTSEPSPCVEGDPIDNNARLQSLQVSAGALAPAFAPTVLEYAATVPGNVATVTITATAEDPEAVIRINGVVVAAGTSSAPIALQPGLVRSVPVEVTARDGVSAQYTYVKLTRDDDGAVLSSLSPSAGALQPAFDPRTHDYALHVDNAVREIGFSAAARFPGRAIFVNGEPLQAGASWPLIVGQTRFEFVVEADDGSDPESYVVTVYRPASSDAALAALVPSAGQLVPAFDPEVVDYAVSVSFATQTMALSTTARDPDALITGSHYSVLPVGQTVFTLTTRASDNVTTRTYTVTVTRSAQTSILLESLSTSPVPLGIAFSPTTSVYTIFVEHDVAALSVTASPQDPLASWTVGGHTLTPGQTSPPLALAFGHQQFKVRVLPSDGSSTEFSYRIDVIRRLAPEARLAALLPSVGTLAPLFTPNQATYTLAIPADVGSVQLTPTLQSTATSMTVAGQPVASGDASPPIAVPPGSSTAIPIVVNAADGSHSVYTVTVIRPATTKVFSSGFEGN